MRVVANWTDNYVGVTEGKFYNLTENGCENDRGHFYTDFTSKEGETLLERWEIFWENSGINGMFTEVKKEMDFKKSDLKTGLHAVEMRNESFCIVIGEQLLGKRFWMPLHLYEESLYLRQEELNFDEDDEDYMSNGFDIIRAYKHKGNFDSCLGAGLEGLTKDKYELIWERETEQQEDIEQDLALKELKELKETIEKASKQIDEIERRFEINVRR